MKEEEIKKKLDERKKKGKERRENVKGNKGIKIERRKRRWGYEAEARKMSGEK